MAIRITADIDTSKVSPLLRRYAQRVESATATALTRVAQSAQRQITSTMPRAFDRPTRWTLGSTYIQPAGRPSKGGKLESWVYIKDRDAGDVAGEKSHLWAQIRGGGRRIKPFEFRLQRRFPELRGRFLVPTEFAPRDQYGNVPANYIRQILSQLQAANAADNSGYDSNVKRGAAQSAQSKRRQAKAGTFFVPPPGQMPLGIYRRVRTVFGWVTRMVFYAATSQQYRVRLPFEKIIEDVRRREIQGHFDRELARISQD